MSAAIKCAGCGKFEDALLEDGFALNRPPAIALPEGWYRIVAQTQGATTYGHAPEVSADVCSKECAVLVVIRWADPELEEAIELATQALGDRIERQAEALRSGDSDSLGTFRDGRFTPNPTPEPFVPVPGEDPFWMIPKFELAEDFDIVNWQAIGAEAGQRVSLGTLRMYPMAALTTAAWIVTVAGIIDEEADLPHFMAILDRVRST